MFEIVSFGDVVVLTQVFNSIAAIFADSTYKAAASAIALFVFIASMMSTLSSGKQDLPIPSLLAAFFLYIAAFSTFTSVSIENRYDGTITRIDNVPIGVAVPASLFSSIGLELSELIETAFGNVNSYDRISETGYLKGLQHIAMFQNIAKQACPFGVGQSVIGGINICTSQANYFRDCSMVVAKRDGLTQTMQDGDFLEEMKFDSKAYSTVIVNGANQEIDYSCKDAYTEIRRVLDSSGFEQAINTHNKAFGLQKSDNLLDETNRVMESIANDSAAGRALAKTAFIIGITQQGEYEFLQKNGSMDLAENLHSSIEKRNYEWALQGDMWIQIVNKFITIIEAILYAITPFIGLMAICGTVGAKSVLLFLQMMGVIQLMPPMLVVTQNIIQMNFERTIDVLHANYDIGSVNYLFQMLNRTNELMGIGGLIAATVVPALAMALVTGSGMAVMGALKGAAAAPKDADAAPELTMQGGAMTNLGATNEGQRDHWGNTWTTSAQERVGNLTQATAAGSSITATSAKAKTAEEAYSDATSNLASTVQRETSTTGKALKFGDSIMSANSSTSAFVNEQANQLIKTHGINDSEQSDFKNLMAAGLEGKALGVLKLGANLSSGHSQNYSKEFKEAYSDAMSGKNADSIMANWQDTKSRVSEEGQTYIKGDDDTNAQMHKVESTRKEALSSKEEYQKAQTAQQVLQHMATDTKGAMYRLGKDEDAIKHMGAHIDENMQDPVWRKNFEKEFSAMSGGVDATHLDQDTAKVAAFMAANIATGQQADTMDVLYQSTYGQDALEGHSFTPNAPNAIEGAPEYGALSRQEIEDVRVGSVSSELTEHPESTAEIYSHNNDGQGAVTQEQTDFREKNQKDFDAISGYDLPFHAATTSAISSALKSMGISDAAEKANTYIARAEEKTAEAVRFMIGDGELNETDQKIYDAAISKEHSEEDALIAIKAYDNLHTADSLEALAEKSTNAAANVTLNDHAADIRTKSNKILDDLGINLQELGITDGNDNQRTNEQEKILNNVEETHGKEAKEEVNGAFNDLNKANEMRENVSYGTIYETAQTLTQANELEKSANKTLEQYDAQNEIKVEETKGSTASTTAGSSEILPFTYDSDIQDNPDKQDIYKSVREDGHSHEDAERARTAIDKLAEINGIEEQLDDHGKTAPSEKVANAEGRVDELRTEIEAINKEFGLNVSTGNDETDTAPASTDAADTVQTANASADTAPVQTANAQADVYKENNDKGVISDLPPQSELEKQLFPTGANNDTNNINKPNENNVEDNNLNSNKESGTTEKNKLDLPML